VFPPAANNSGFQETFSSNFAHPLIKNNDEKHPSEQTEKELAFLLKTPAMVYSDVSCTEMFLSNITNEGCSSSRLEQDKELSLHQLRKKETL